MCHHYRNLREVQGIRNVFRNVSSGLYVVTSAIPFSLFFLCVDLFRCNLEWARIMMAIRFHELPPQYQRNVLKPYSHMNILNELKLIFSSSESVILVSIIRKCMLTSEAVRCAIRGLIPIKNRKNSIQTSNEFEKYRQTDLDSFGYFSSTLRFILNDLCVCGLVSVCYHLRQVA